jgi:hypothetical protein
MESNLLPQVALDSMCGMGDGWVRKGGDAADVDDKADNV